MTNTHLLERLKSIQASLGQNMIMYTEEQLEVLIEEIEEELIQDGYDV